MTYKELAQIFQKEGYEIYLVGGCVRDKLMRLPPHDIDFCSNATPAQMNKLCSKYHLFHTNVGEKYGTIVFYDARRDLEPSDAAYEVTTYRRESTYTDGRHPNEVSFTPHLLEDLSRRDFTINAMAQDPVTGEVIDPFHGQEDLKNKVLRCVGDANTRLEEDALRILRALRFAIKYELTIDPELSKAMHEKAHTLTKVSKERRTEELKKIMTCGKPAKQYFMEYRDILAVLLPGLEQCFDVDQNNKWHNHDVYEHMVSVYDNCNSTNFPVKLAALLHDIGKPSVMTTSEDGQNHFHGHPKAGREICEKLLPENLALTRKELKFVLDLVEHHDIEIPVTEAGIKRKLVKFGPELFENLLILREADRNDHRVIVSERFPSNEEIWTIYKKILEEEAAFHLSDLAVSGADIMDYFRIHPGKEVGLLLNKAFDAVLDGRLPNKADAILSFLDAERTITILSSLDTEREPDIER